MQEGIMQIGNAVYSEDSAVENILMKLQSERKNKQQHVLKFNFKTEEDILDIDVKEEVSQNTAKKYLVVDKIGGPNSPQWLVSKNTCQYHLTETIPSLSKISFSDELDCKIKKVFEKFYVDLGEDVDNKYRYVLNLKKYGIGDEEPEKILEELLKKENTKKAAYKKIGSEYKKILQNYVKDEKGINSNQEVGLYTILIDDIPIAEYEEYRNEVIKQKLGTKTKQKSNSKNKKVKQNSLCSMCGKCENEKGDLKKISIKFFTTNQIIFASELNKKNYDKNMIICQECMNKLISAERYIMNNLRSKLAGFDVFLIPHFIIGEPLCREDLDASAEKIRNSFNSAKSHRSIVDFKVEVNESKDIDDENFYYLMNIVFYKKVNQGTKIRRLIKDVNPSVFEDIEINSNKANKLFKKVIGEKFNSQIKLESIYYLTPIRLKQGEAQHFNRLLSIYDALFTRRKMDKKVIIKNILDVIDIQYFDKKGYNVKKDEKNGINFTIIKGNMLLKFLEYMGCLKEVKSLEKFDLYVSDDIKNYIQKMGYNMQQTGMFLLGYLMGQVGNSQYKRSSEGKKPVLNKLNFGGIDKRKILRLCNDVFNKMNQEKILKYNEKTFSECKRLIDMNLNSWKLNKDENLFYILSGYGYSTTKPMLSSRQDSVK
ncbi:TIGR02556 family CRISPR-associated protein [Haloimpatiens sp. FM7330]|uniref:TIGR02556 family CRISPR-associated protein n=1 Tax=Haloimpatiens sp. FM7330 TaxID=3298610 RepID=UPI003645AE6D